MTEDLWYKDAIIYEVHVKCFYDSTNDGIGDFRGLTEKLDYLQDLGVTAIWLLPFYPSPLKDDGYDIADYTDVNPSYGTLKDFRQFLREAHKRGMRVITELVINHTSDQHPWFQKSRRAKKGSRLRDFYVWSETSERYKEARIIFQDFETSNWAWDTVAKSYYWHRFYYHQPDLNFDNPNVHKAIFNIVSFWLKMGVDGIRLDAVPYLYEREGTSCENLPETHTFLKKLRTFVDENFKDRMLLAEANQWPEDAAKYFGNGDECHMAFHFPMMPRFFMAIHLEDSLPIIEISGQTPPIPENSQWALFLRNHDELTLEMVTDEERDYMFRVFANDPQARLNLGIRHRLAPLLKNDRRKIELMNSLLFSLAGTPVIYYGDEIGMGDNIYLGDRNGVRTPMQWSSDRNAGFSRGNPQKMYLPPIIDPEYHYETVNVEAQAGNPNSLLWWTKQLIALRKRFKAFGSGTTQFLLPENRRVLVFLREYKDELLLIISNLSRYPQYVELDLSRYNGYQLIELFSGETFPNIGELPYFLTLGPYGYYWFAMQNVAVKVETSPKKIFTLQVTGKEEEKIFHSRSRHLLEDAVIEYLKSCSWFLDRKYKIGNIEISNYFKLPFEEEKHLHLVFIQILYENGILETVPLFLAFVTATSSAFRPERVMAKLRKKEKEEEVFLVDLTETKEIGNFLLRMIRERKKIRGEMGELRGIPVDQRAKKNPLLVAGKEIESVRQENKTLSFTFGDEILKIFRFVEEGLNPDIEMRRFLMEKTSFRGFLPLLGYLEYRSRNAPALAIAEQILSYPQEFNAKSLAIEEAEKFLLRVKTSTNGVSDEILLPKKTWMELSETPLPQEMHPLLEEAYLEAARKLGEMTAEFHLAVGTAENEASFISSPLTLFYQRSLYQRFRSLVSDGLKDLKRSATKLTDQEKKMSGALIDKEALLLKRLHWLLEVKLTGLRIRYHGDLYLENLIYTGKEFLIANFDGNSKLSVAERRYKSSCLQDVATILFSFAEASLLAIEKQRSRGLLGEEPIETLYRWALSWSIWIGSSFLNAYFKKINSPLFLPQNKKEIDLLLSIFLIEKCIENIKGKVEVSAVQLLYWLPLYEKQT